MNSHEQQETMEAAAKAIHEGLQAPPVDDEPTGLPELPEGQFWRVTSRPVFERLSFNPLSGFRTVEHGCQQLTVTLMENHTRVRHVLRGGALMRFWASCGFAVPWDEVKETGVRPLANRACVVDDAGGVLTAARGILDELAAASRRAALLGDYPPHRLGEDRK